MHTEMITQLRSRIAVSFAARRQFREVEHWLHLYVRYCSARATARSSRDENSRIYLAAVGGRENYATGSVLAVSLVRSDHSLTRACEHTGSVSAGS